MMPQQNDHNMCNKNLNDFNSQCRPSSMPVNESYMGAAMSSTTNPCTSHSNYQMCNQNGYINNCQNNKLVTNYNCHTYQPVPNSGYNCIPNMTEPLPSPAMATPAPSDIMSQPQQAQLTRLCTHYVQNCYPSTSQCVPNPQNIQNGCNNCSNCRKNSYNQPQNKCYNQCGNTEIQCKDISQSQMSPGITSATPSQNGNINGTTMLGMRQDAYQRTLEYVQNCQSWVNSEMVTSSTHPLTKCGEKVVSKVIKKCNKIGGPLPVPGVLEFGGSGPSFLNKSFKNVCTKRQSEIRKIDGVTTYLDGA
ncbi:hypothetical protein NQ318_010408 [Aromia moschata]|uniref:Uncharacterized protein n=1 Tax=Aromia moschata TaxID=1265417 RepID=A0AAV8Y406_9CUCU|nr:hypothetical protein NQ318_010408 [Aromia moschata]